MVGTITRLLVFVMLSCGLAPAQDVAFACQAPAEIKALTLERVRARLNAGQHDFFLYKRLEDLTPSTPKPGILASAFQQTLQQHPDDAGFLYLYGRSLIGKDTPQAIVYLNRAAEAAPKLPWTHLARAEIYASRNFKDDARVMANIREYRKLCPGNLEGFRYLEKVKDAAETAEAARQLRAVLEKAEDPDDGRYWSLLWAAEFRVAPSTEYDALRKRVAADVEHLKSRPEPRNRDYLIALADGYKLTGQMEAAAKVDMEFGQDEDVVKAYRAWEEKRNIRTRNTTTPEQHRVDMEELATAATAWVKEWPSSAFAWQTRLNTLSLQPNWTKEEMEKAGEEVLKNDKRRAMGWTMVPRGLRVAQAWVRHGIRPTDCVAMGEASLEQILLGPEVESDLTAPRNAAEIAALRVFGFDTTVWDAMGVVVEGSVQLRDFGKARRMLTRMQQWLNDNQFKKDDSTSGYMRFEARYLHYAGEVAEAEGHKLDALGLYVRATGGGWRDPDAMEHARALWVAQGGSKEGWDLAVQRLPGPTPRDPSRYMVTSATEFAPWTKAGLALPEMTLPDATGKMWAVKNLQGKTTFINVWATWCAPCREELPSVQKLYELVKGRQDIQMITLNADQNPGEVQPFLTEHHYTFPVVMARRYLEDFPGSFPIPQNWMVDRAGILQQKSVGFDTKVVDWPKEMLERLTRVQE
jgi:thiol-disulfide isomerase/thioredoxin